MAGMCNLGYCYYTGIGVKVDYNEAVKWFMEAVKRGQPRAMDLMGDCYRLGKGVPVDYDRAYKLYEGAYAKGYKMSAIGLGICLYYGYGCQADWPRAKPFLEEGAERYNDEDCKKLLESVNKAGGKTLTPSGGQAVPPQEKKKGLFGKLFGK